jgi:hypothetical protein
MIGVRAKVSREFEDFTLFDAQCSQQPDIWIWLGGDVDCKTNWEAMDSTTAQEATSSFGA